jgi:hypothetical protein
VGKLFYELGIEAVVARANGEALKDLAWVPADGDVVESVPIDTDETATQQLPRVQPPLPGSLDPVRRTSTAETTAPAPTSSDGHDSTAVLSLDDLMGPPQPVQTAPSVAVPPPPPPVAAVPTPTPTPAPPATTSVHPASRPTPPPTTASGPSVADRVRRDAAAAWSAGMRRSQDWLSTGDNAVIAATALVALLLLVMVAAL